MIDPGARAIEGRRAARSGRRLPVRPALLTSGVAVMVAATTWLRWARREQELTTRTQERLGSAAPEQGAN